MSASTAVPRPALDGYYEDVYRELARIAHGRFSRATPTLDTVALIHEAYLRLHGSSAEWRESEHVKAVACSAMRQILLNHLRDGQAARRGGGRPESLGDADAEDRCAFSEDDLLVRLDGLSALDALDPRMRRVAEMRFFGYELDEIAETLGVARATVVRDWRYARALLRAYAG